MAKVESVNEYINNHPKWKENLFLLRELMLSSNLSETIKWGSPVYTKDGKNLIGIAAFKNYYGLWFMVFSRSITSEKYKFICKC